MIVAEFEILSTVLDCFGELLACHGPNVHGPPPGVNPFPQFYCVTDVTGVRVDFRPYMADTTCMDKVTTIGSYAAGPLYGFAIGGAFGIVIAVLIPALVWVGDWLEEDEEEEE